ncbi:PREDICTED: transcription factor E4F1 [Nanorana parkeri]|uniref:transcription factor E4F1 n=1 Tax=Nanorana parkeri TaxID=125878 RepID=UPI0008540C4D|nr:PREDICTED: transcription factor E4F1 [Nanorana parkeri]
MSSEPGVGETEEAAPSSPLSLAEPAAALICHYREEDEDDVHKCGRCQTEFTSLEEFVQHKVQKVCQKVVEPSLEPSIPVLSTQEQVVPCVEDPVSITHVVVEASSLSEEIITADGEAASEELKEAIPTEETVEDEQRSDTQEYELDWHGSSEEAPSQEETPVMKMVVDEKGRYVCQLCEKTFKTANILKAHMLIHTNRKDFVCRMCGDAFRTKGSLIRHHRRHTDERPYVCSKCGKSFRESGALSRHMRSLTPCTEKLMINMEKTYMNSRDENSSDLASTDTSSQTGTDEVNGSPVVRFMADEKGNLLHEVQVQAVAVKPRTEIILANTEELVCPQCGEICKTSNSLKVHLKGHEGCKLYRCDQCGREFLKAHLLRKHRESHGNNRKYKCGECGKTYKTVAHVKGHMRVHSDDRPFPCSKCGKRYKTKNAQQVHYRTHFADRPFVCPYCPNSFREKGSLVRHIRHHTGEKPYKCHKCGRAFAEHGTLNRHIKTKGGCAAHLQNLAGCGNTSVAEDILCEEPHTVLVEFSSVVADTQEYIIEASSEDFETSEAAELLQSTGSHEVSSMHTCKLEVKIVNTASPGHQIIVQNVTLDDSTEPCIEEIPTTDTITIATPESLTEQVALTLASVVGDGTVITSEVTAGEEMVVPEEVVIPEEVAVPEEVVTQEDVEMEEDIGEFVITTIQEEEVEVQTVIV